VDSVNKFLRGAEEKSSAFFCCSGRGGCEGERNIEHPTSNAEHRKRGGDEPQNKQNTRKKDCHNEAQKAQKWKRWVNRERGEKEQRKFKISDLRFQRRGSDGVGLGGADAR